MKNVLTRAIVESLLFLENCNASELDDDAVVAQMELLAAILSELDKSEREEFIGYVGELAAEEEKEGASDRVKFMKSLPETIGLVD